MKPVATASHVKRVRFNPRTLRATPSKPAHPAKTARIGRRGLHDLLEIYRGLDGFHSNTIGFQEYTTTYGEMTEAGIQILSEKFKTYAPLSKFPQDRRTFYDLGCGIGKIVVGVAILNPDIRAKGIEIIPDRIRQANNALQRIKTRSVASRVQFSQGSFIESTVSLRDACWIYISNLCFDETTQKIIASKLEAEVVPGCVIITSKEFPFSTNPSRFDKVEASTNIPMTWSATSMCIVYRRNLSP
jgi:SAM-dependent methyltransferase